MLLDDNTKLYDDNKTVQYSKIYCMEIDRYQIQYNIRTAKDSGGRTLGRQYNLIQLSHGAQVILSHVLEFYKFNSILQAFARSLLTKKPYTINDTVYLQRASIANEEMLEVYVDARISHYIAKVDAIYLNSVFGIFLRKAFLFEE